MLLPDKSLVLSPCSVPDVGCEEQDEKFLGLIVLPYL